MSADYNPPGCWWVLLGLPAVALAALVYGAWQLLTAAGPLGEAALELGRAR